MEPIAIPFRFHGSVLRRCDPVQAVLSLIEAMARTPRGSWRGGEAFGIWDLLSDAPRRPEALREAAREINRAFVQLGIENLTVESIRPDESMRDGNSYTVALSSAGEPLRAHLLKVNGAQ